MSEEERKNKEAQWMLFVDRMMDTVDSVISQFTSGRWILTVAAAVIMVSCCWNNIENAKQFKEILAVIIYAYFQRGDRSTAEKNGQDVPKVDK